MKEIIITFDDGRHVLVPYNSTYYDLSLKETNSNNIIGVLIDGKVLSLNEKITKNNIIKFIDITNPYGNRMYVAGLKMVFELATKKCYPNIKVNYSYNVPNGIIANLISKNKLEKKDIELIIKMVDEIIKKNIHFEKLIIKNNDAINYYEDIGNVVKADNVRNIIDPTVILYELDDLVNYYYSEMPYSTGTLNKYEIKYLGNNRVVIIIPSVNSDGYLPNYVNYDGIVNAYVDGQKWLDIMNVPFIKDVNKEICNGNIENFIKSCELNFNIEINETAKIVSQNKELKYVMISGPSSSGKTTITKRLGSYFKIYGLDPIIISLDDYYKERVDSPKDKNGEYDFECLECTDLDYLKKDITKLLNGQEITLPRFNFVTGCKELTSKKIKLKENSIILFEGLHAINNGMLPFIPDKSKYKIYVSPFIPLSIDEHNYISNADLRLLRRIVRDFRTRGYDVSTTIKNSRKVTMGEDKYIIPLIPEADKIINTSLSYEVGILKVFVEPLLYSVPSTSQYYSEARRLLRFLNGFFTISGEYVPKDSILREFIGGSEYD